jgi:hypothetical protein
MSTPGEMTRAVCKLATRCCHLCAASLLTQIVQCTTMHALQMLLLSNACCSCLLFSFRACLPSQSLPMNTHTVVSSARTVQVRPLFAAMNNESMWSGLQAAASSPAATHEYAADARKAAEDACISIANYLHSVDMTVTERQREVQKQVAQVGDAIAHELYTCQLCVSLFSTRVFVKHRFWHHAQACETHAIDTARDGDIWTRSAAQAPMDALA